VVEEMDQCLKNAVSRVRWPFRKIQFTTIRDTVLIVAFIKAHYPDSAELWELVVLKARGWVERLSDPEVLRSLEQIARDNMQTSSATVSAPGSSDVLTKPLEPAVSKVNAEEVDKVGEDNVTKDVVEDRSEKDTVVEAESG
jgi:hypothetical protein